MYATDTHQFSSSQLYTPTVFNNVLDMEVNGEPIELALWDTTGQGGIEGRLRPSNYPETHSFLICFSIDWPNSLENILEIWDPEVKHFGGARVPLFLVGCKKDLRNDEETLRDLARGFQVPVTTEQGKEMAKAIGAEYFECSSKTGEGVRELFARVTENIDAERMVPLKRTNRSYSHRGCIIV
jgi:Ras homolog gene family, member A